MMRQRLLKVSIALSLLTVVTLALVGVLSRAPSRAKASGANYATIGGNAITNMINDFYNNGQWKKCTSGCSSTDNDWGADSLTYTLWLRWKINNHDGSVVSDLNALANAYPTPPTPCTDGSSCPLGQLSDVWMWDSIALGREYEATGEKNPTILQQEEHAFNVDDLAGSSVYAFGDCPGIFFQHPGAREDQGKTDGPTKTLESDSNYIKAALLLYRYTKDSSYLTKAENHYAAVRQSYLDPNLPLYSVYVFDYHNGTGCQQKTGRFFASVNGNMIYNGLTLAGDTTGSQSQGYLNDALNTAQAVVNNLSDNAGVYADLQAENDIGEPLIEAMYDVAVGSNSASQAATQWLARAASASASSLKSDGSYSRFFDGPPNPGTSTAWQSNGGYALAVAEAGLNPNGSPATTAAWANAKSTSTSYTSFPVTIPFYGSGIALFGPLGDQCCNDGHARVYVDNVLTTDTTGIWQNKSSAGIRIPNTVLFAWRWPSAGNHTIVIQPGITNPKEGGPYINITSYQVAP